MKFLFVVNAETHYRELKRLCQCLHAVEPQEYYFYNTYTDQVYFFSEPPLDWRSIEHEFTTNVKWHDTLPQIRSVISCNKILRSIFQNLKTLTKAIVPFSIILILERFLLLRYKKINFIQQSLKYQFDVVVLAEANVEFNSELYVRASKKLDIPCIVVPYTLCSPKEPALFFEHNPLHKINFLESIFLYLSRLDNWVYNFKDKDILRLPWDRIFSLVLSRNCPPLPWVQESASSAWIIAESANAKAHYISHGIDHKNIIELGGYAQDLIYTALQKKELIKEELLHFFSKEDRNKPIIICSFPANYTNRNQYKCEFSNYEDLVFFWISVLKNQSSHNVIINPHPIIEDKAIFYKHISSNLTVSELPIHSLMAVSDMYIACISATIKWAIILGLPVINYDVYNFDYQDYINAKGVITVSKKNDFENIFYKMIENETFRNEMKTKQYEVKDNWGKIDGKFAENFLKFCKLKSKKNYCAVFEDTVEIV